LLVFSQFIAAGLFLLLIYFRWSLDLFEKPIRYKKKFNHTVFIVDMNPFTVMNELK